MKDYTLGCSKDKEFILDYEIEDDKLIIKYASGKIEKVVYTNGMLKEILLKMKEQVLKIKDLEVKINKKNSFDLRLITVFLFLSMFFIHPLVHLIISLSMIGIFIGKFCERVFILRDYNKNKLFIENMNLFQNNISRNYFEKVDIKHKEDLEYLVNLREQQDKFKVEVLMFFDEKYSILREPTIKTIDDLSYESVEEIYNVLSNNGREEIKVKKKVLTKNS